MAKPEPGAALPLLTVRGSHAALGHAMGERQQTYIRRVVAQAQAAFDEQGTSAADLREQNAPFVAAAARTYPQYLTELAAMAAAAGVPFDALFRLNCYEARPPSTPREPAPAAVKAKDEAVLQVANDPAAIASAPAAAPADGCTSIASRGTAGVVVGHTEDSSPEALPGLYLLDATVEDPAGPGAGAANGGASRFLTLNYAQTLPGCAAGVNAQGLIVLIDALPDPDRHVGAPRHFVSRALLDLPTIDAAVDHLRHTDRGGGWNYLLVQGDRIVDVEATATRLVVHEAGPSGTYAHANHYVDPDLAAAAGDPRPNSVARLSRALELVSPQMTTAQMQRLLGDRQNAPDSICRERTIGAFVSDSATRRVEVCWGEPDGATWTGYTY